MSTNNHAKAFHAKAAAWCRAKVQAFAPRQYMDVLYFAMMLVGPDDANEHNDPLIQTSIDRTLREVL